MRSPMPALVASLLARGASACDSSYLFPNVTESGEPSTALRSPRPPLPMHPTLPAVRPATSSCTPTD